MDRTMVDAFLAAAGNVKTGFAEPRARVPEPKKKPRVITYERVRVNAVKGIWVETVVKPRP